MAFDNEHAHSGDPLQGSTPVSRMWARQLNSQANRMEKETGQPAGRGTWSFFFTQNPA
jgi:hypothetical protein